LFLYLEKGKGSTSSPFEKRTLEKKNSVFIILFIDSNSDKIKKYQFQYTIMLL